MKTDKTGVIEILKKENENIQNVKRNYPEYFKNKSRSESENI
jgi:hypothetical protein